MPPKIVNIAAYKFLTLTGLPELRASLREKCEQLSLKGTILVSPEGINLFLAGTRKSIDAILSHLRALPGLSDLYAKESLSDTQPFQKLLVKLKREIIAFQIPNIAPATYTSPRLSPQELKAWLDAGKPVTLLDTRNTYEIEHGTFTNAIKLPLNDFRNFPKLIASLANDLKSAPPNQPIVTFCTGGIRCEKAAPYLESQGFQNVYQLEGGILNYFEKVGSNHYDGTCFVFDERTALTPDLAPVKSNA